MLDTTRLVSEVDSNEGTPGCRTAPRLFRPLIWPPDRVLTRSAPAQGAAGRVDAAQAAAALAHLARVGQTGGRAVTDVAVGAAPAEEALARGHV